MSDKSSPNGRVTNNTNNASGGVTTPSFTIPQSTSQTPPIFPSYNSQNIGGDNKLRRIGFSYMNEVFVFHINPEEYEQVEPNRVQVTQTKSGGWVDDFGGGIQTISFRGTTGFKRQVMQHVEYTFTKFKQLRDMIRKYYYKSSPGTEVTRDKELVFHNYTDGEHWVVVPKVFTLRRSISRPLLYSYEIQLICLRPADIPADQDEGYSPIVPLVGVKK